MAEVKKLILRFSRHKQLHCSQHDFVHKDDLEAQGYYPVMLKAGWNYICTVCGMSSR